MIIDSKALYLDSHEWARQDGEHWTIGISDYAQDSLGDLVFIEFPELGARLERGERFAVVESVKAASELYIPLDCEVVECNTGLLDSPSLMNTDPFGNGWILKIKTLAPSKGLMNAEEYKNFCAGLGD